MTTVKVKDRTKDFSKEKELDRSLVEKIELPTSWGLLSHWDNIEYGIEQLKKYSKKISKPVIGYNLGKGLGIRQSFYRILPLERAEELKKKNSTFRYCTLDDLLAEKKACEEGKYKVRDGHFIALNPDYNE